MLDFLEPLVGGGQEGVLSVEAQERERSFFLDEGECVGGQEQGVDVGSERLGHLFGSDRSNSSQCQCLKK